MHQQGTSALEQIRDQHWQNGNGRDAVAVDCAIQILTDGEITEEHVNAIDSLWREQADPQAQGDLF